MKNNLELKVNEHQVSIQDIRNVLKELAEEHKKTELAQQKIELAQQATDRKINKLTKNIGGLGNSFGRYTEGILGQSIKKILQTKLGAEYVTGNIKSNRKGIEFEVDYFGACTGDLNKAFVVEVKTTLQEKHINQLLKNVQMLPKIITEHKGKKVYGILAAEKFTDKQKQKILDKGFYFLNITNELAHLDVPKNFKPKEF